MQNKSYVLKSGHSFFVVRKVIRIYYLTLPKKLEQNEYCPLTTEQAALYESFLDETKFKLNTLTGFEKKGLILTMLSRLKQL